MNKTNYIKNILKTLLILSLCLGACFIMQYTTKDDKELIPSIFILGAFLTSVITPGYVYGISAALISVLTVNFAFTSPFFSFDFTVPKNILSASILLIITVITCGLTTKIKQQEAVKNESEREKMRANLLRAVSHDLRTPLTTIYGSSSALSDNYENFTDEQKKKILKGITEDAQWLNRMVENLLSVTRLDNDNVSIIKTTTVLDELIDSVLLKFAKRYPNNRVHVDIPDELIFIPMDAMLIEQVIINLLENAVIHAKGMTKLTLRVFTVSDKAIFEIKDNGCGIAKDRLPDLFTGFHCTPSPTSDSSKNNAGIGLSVCASIIKAHGGDIKAENIKNGGCIFRFALNMEDSDNG